MPHTPGPWTIEEYGDDECPALVIHKDTESRVCFMATPGSHGDPAVIEADAKLIAAAPDLLAALQLFTKASMFESRPARGESFIGWQRGDGADSDTAMKAARAAIAKATT